MGWLFLQRLLNVFSPYIDHTKETQQPVRRSLIRSIRKNFHWKCFLLSLFIDGCLVYMFLCRLSYAHPYTPSRTTGNTNSYTHAMAQTGPCSQGYNFIPVAFGVMLYVVYVMECWHSKIRQDLVCKLMPLQTDSEAVMEHLRKMRSSVPVVWWRAVCYHYIRRTRQVTRYRNGDAVTTTQVYYERVNSHTAGSLFLYQECGVKDISKRLVGLQNYPVTKIRFSKGFVFANLQAANEFEDQRTRFFQENEMRDDYMEVREGLDLAECPFKEYMICFANPKRRPWYCTQVAFWLLSLVLLSWPLRVFLESRTAYVHFQVTKLFGTHYLSPSSGNYTGPLTRVSTMDSGDLEAAVRQSLVVVPSYSEAMLMDNNHSSQADPSRILHDRTEQVTVQRSGRVGSLRPAADSSEALCNSELHPPNNYGALTQPPHEPFLYPDEPPRSQSLNFFRLGRGTSRSISIGSLSGAQSRAYRTLPTTPDDDPTVVSAPAADTYPHEPPPPYELAVRMCAPLYQRIRQSASSIRGLARLAVDGRPGDNKVDSLPSSSASRSNTITATSKDADTML